MDKLEKNLRNLLSSILIPKFTKKDNKIIVIDAKKGSIEVKLSKAKLSKAKLS